MKRLFSFLLAAVMVFALLPGQVLATETGTATLTVSGSSYYNRYVVISDGTDSDLYLIGSDGTVVSTSGAAVTFPAGSYTVYYGNGSSGSGRGNESTFASGTFTVAEGAEQASVSLSTARVSNSSADVYLYATSLFYNKATFDHVDVRVAGSYVIHVGSQEYTATVSNPHVVVKVGGQEVASQDWTGSEESYEWRQTGLTLTKSSIITVELTLDLTYTDSTGQTHVLENVEISYNSVNNPDKFIDAIAICDMVQGLDFRVTVQDLEEEIQYYTVSYEWRVYNADGTYTVLPAGTPDAPEATSGHVAGEQYVYDTEYYTGTSFYDYDNGLLYTFHGWDTSSHSDVYSPVPSTGYNALDDGDANADNNATVEITDDTYIYGYWTVTELDPSSAYIAIEKVFIVDGQEMALTDAEDLWFRIDTGIDRDGDDDTLIDVDYLMIAAAGGVYKIPVYQYDTPFVFTEQNAEVPGYTRTTTIAVSGEHITDFETDGDSVTVTMDPVYQGENVHLGTVTFTNSYEKNVGEAVSQYPTLTLLKTASDTRLAQAGVEFTLYADEACLNPITTVTTGAGGLAYLNFANIADVAPGTYYLRETQALPGYLADPALYAITLTAGEPVEELRGDQFVQVTTYSLSVAVPESSVAVYTAVENRLHIFNDPILGALTLRKTAVGLAEEDAAKLNADVFVHGPITRAEDGSITDIGDTWELTLNSENSYQVTVDGLPIGEYLIHESFASVHGYTWTGVTYGNLTEKTVYNGIESHIFTIAGEDTVELQLTNTYEEWTSADFFIRKLNEKGAVLSGATFTLFTDPACTVPASGDFTVSATTGQDGYAHFTGYTVPEGQESVTYYLKETKAPAGYYLSDQVYQVTIQAVTANGKTTYEPVISLLTGRNTGFNIVTDLLTVYNYSITGQLTVTKAFTDGIIPAGLTSLYVQVGGPDGFQRTVELNADNAWSVTLTGLPLGEYTVAELDANMPGYTWNVDYSSTAVLLAEAEPGLTTAQEQISGAVTVTNTYTANEEFFEVPASLTVQKVSDTGAPLAGAVFTMTRFGPDGKTVMESVSFTTGADGKAVFGLLYGFADDAGNITEGIYQIAETKAPAGYEKTDRTWTVTVTEDDGKMRVELNEDRNVFEHFWDWIVGNVSPGTWANGVLQVVNYPVTGQLTVTKDFADDFIPEGLEAVSVQISGPNNYAKTLELSDANNWRVTLQDLPLGEYTVAEQDASVPGYTWNVAYSSTAVTLAEADPGNTAATQTVSAAVQITNTYTVNEDYLEVPATLTVHKISHTGESLAGAVFTLERLDQDGVTVIGSAVMTTGADGLATFDQLTGFANDEGVLAAGVYILSETAAPEGYLKTDATWTVTVTEDDGVRRMVLNENRNTFELFWDWVIGQVSPGTWANGVLEIVNYPATDVSVQKVWYNQEGEIPASVDVVLYCDGAEYETVTLSEENNWSYTWTGLPALSQWTVDEPSVPSGYTKTVTRQDNNFTVTNTYEDIPKTGDFTNLLGTGVMAAAGMAGFGFSAAALFRPRKKKEQEEDC